MAPELMSRPAPAINPPGPDYQAFTSDLPGAVASVRGIRAAPIRPDGLRLFVENSRNGFMMSIGIGKTTVEFCSAPISVSVCR